MKVTWVPVGRFETGTTFAEVDLARDAGVNHPLQCAIDGGAADAVIVGAYEIDEVIGAEVAFLAQEDIDDLLPLTRALAAGGLEPAEIGKSRRHQPNAPAGWTVRR